MTMVQPCELAGRMDRSKLSQGALSSRLPGPGTKDYYIIIMVSASLGFCRLLRTRPITMPRTAQISNTPHRSIRSLWPDASLVLAAGFMVGEWDGA